MAITQPKAIVRLYGEVVTNGLVVDESEKIETIIEKCQQNGKFLIHVDSYWSFVKTTCNGRNCIRMIFALKDNDGGKVQNIDRIVELIKNLERTLIFVDNIKIVKKSDFIYLDVIKYVNE